MGVNMKEVLVIEDNLVNSYIIESILSRKGYTVIQSTSACRGIELATKGMLELIIIDIHIADMDGLEAVRRINLLAPWTPLIALTSHDMTNEKEKAINAGCTACIEKPIDSDTFAEQLERYLY
jgi:two-component system cell cycle response regulator DivK